jgi:ferredoxin-NADP reductase
MAKRRLRHETWYALHLYTYLAIALSFSHELATGNDFVTHRGNRVLWVGLYVLTFALLVVFRVLVPARNALRYRLQVSSVVREPSGAVSLYLTGRQLDRMGAEAGQFFRWRFLTRDRWWQSHPFSLSAAPNRQLLRVTAKGVGDHSRGLAAIRPGTRVMAEGPYGNFTARRRTRAKVLCIAGGVGVTPLRALLEELAAQPGDLVLIYRASRDRDVLFREEFEQLAAAKGIVVHYVLGGRDKNRHALSPERLRGLVPDVSERDVYLCGPPGMMDAAAKSLRTLGVRRAQLHTERFEL